MTNENKINTDMSKTEALANQLLRGGGAEKDDSVIKVRRYLAGQDIQMGENYLAGMLLGMDAAKKQPPRESVTQNQLDIERLYAKNAAIALVWDEFFAPRVDTIIDNSIIAEFRKWQGEMRKQYMEKIDELA